ncbi:uncharacterized protein [Lepeophtheirus salmonis]|uniref:uncharacterized protein n=1 Tax=Lepeophtheirus salmonis TaxID=72036 RepID=UPI001AEA71DC|nr:uncharacterized protein LOC121128135 [Lepeophtheirus salmonis]
MQLCKLGSWLCRRGGPMVSKAYRCCSTSSSPPDAGVMEETSKRIHREVSLFFLRKPSSDWIRPDFVFENRSTNKTIVGGLQYYRSLLLFKAWGNFRFPFILFRIRQSETNLENGTVTLHWDIKGMTQLRLLIWYFPKKLWYPTHMIKHSNTWKEGISVIYVDKDGKLYRHIFDDKVPSSNLKAIFSLKESIQRKIKDSGRVEPQLLSKGEKYPTIHSHINNENAS